MIVLTKLLVKSVSSGKGEKWETQSDQIGLSRLLKFLKYPKICFCLLNILESPKVFLKISKPPNFLLKVSINPLMPSGIKKVTHT